MMASQLDRRIVIQTRTVAQDSYGAAIETWADLATVWAQFLPGGGDERFAASHVYAETQARFRIRWRSGVTPLNRIVAGGKTWDILAVDEIGRRAWLEIKVKAGA